MAIIEGMKFWNPFCICAALAMEAARTLDDPMTEEIAAKERHANRIKELGAVKEFGAYASASTSPAASASALFACFLEPTRDGSFARC